MKKKIALLVLLILATLTITVVILLKMVRNGQLRPIDISFSQIDIRANKDSLDMVFYASINNVRNRIFHPDSLHYQVYMNTTLIANGTSVVSHCDTCTYQNADTIQMPLTLHLDQLRKSRAGKDSSDLHIEMQLYFNLFGFKLNNLPINISKRIKTPQPPEIKILNVNRDQLRLHTLELSIDGTITNNSKFNIQLIHTKFNIYFEGLFDADLDMQDTLSVNANSTQSFKAGASANELQLVRDAFKVIFSAKDHPFVLTGSTYMQLDSSSTPIRVNIFSEGTAPLKPWKKDRKK